MKCTNDAVPVERTFQIGYLYNMKYAFSQGTVNEWNKLLGECINDASVNIMFKNKLDDYIIAIGLLLKEPV